MSPLIYKIAIIFVIAIIMLLLIGLFAAIYMMVLKPWRIKYLQYKKVFEIAAFIMQTDNKVEGLIENDIRDLDLIKTAEEEIKVALARSKNSKKDYLGLMNKIKWRRKNDKKEAVRSTPGGEDQGETGTTKGTADTGTKGRDGPGKKDSGSDSAPSEQRSVQAEPLGYPTKPSRYFS